MNSAQSGTDAARASLAAIDHANVMLGPGVCSSHHSGAGADRLHYVRAGSGPIIVFVHGFPSFWYCWIRQIAALHRRFTCIALDAPGAGASARPPAGAAYRVPALATRLAAFITELAAGAPVLLVGQDWGAALGFALAQARPDLLAGVCGIAAPPYRQFLNLIAENPDQRARSSYMAGLRTMTADSAKAAAPGVAEGAYGRLLARGNIDTDEFALFAAACNDPAAFAGGAAWYAANFPAPGDSPEALAWPPRSDRLAVPAQLIWGDADQTFVPRAADDFAALNPGAEVVHLPGINHWCMMEAAVEVNRHIADLAQRVLRPDAEATQA